jgi:hypothetical protein
MSDSLEKDTAQVLDKLRAVCIDDSVEPIASVLALIRMAGFMLMVAQSRREVELQETTALDKHGFYALAIEELNTAYDAALSTRDTFDLIERVGGTPDE